jgi:A/G-specific adenine glycosylase
MHPISEKLIVWYNSNQRDLPWRNITDPYKIWLSEIILQQTQVVQGLNYYLKFIETFPTVIDLANAPEDQVLRLWQGLGYYSRARNLHAAAKFIVFSYNGQFPNTFQTIKALKGVGDYTAAAIASFAFGLPHAVVDGNVYRVLSRLFNLHTPINSSKGKKEFQYLADELLHTTQPALHNSAIMEFGALWCKPKNPRCEDCPLQENCLAYNHNTVEHLPVKEKSIKIKNRYLHYFVFNLDNEVYIQKRTEKDIWQNLYEFFLIETFDIVKETELFSHANLLSVTDEFEVISVTPVKKHILSHQHLYATFYELKIKKTLSNSNLLKVSRDELNLYGLPQLITKYLEKHKTIRLDG